MRDVIDAGEEAAPTVPTNDAIFNPRFLTRRDTSAREKHPKNLYVI